MLKEQWRPNEQAWFEYHCYEGHDSSDAQAWYRSHQRVTVLHENDGELRFGTMAERGEEGMPVLYTVRFTDGLEYAVFEDELSTSKADWERPDPPESFGGTE